MNPIVKIARWRALRRHASKLPTGIMPLIAVSSATVFLDSSDPECSLTVRAVEEFFADNSIPVKVIQLTKKDINWFGRQKKPRQRKKDNPMNMWEEDLFISLAAKNDFAAEYAARCSKAGFKIGRYQLEGDVFDLAVTPPSGQEAGQAAVFAAIRKYLQKIQ